MYVTPILGMHVEPTSKGRRVKKGGGGGGWRGGGGRRGGGREWGGGMSGYYLNPISRGSRMLNQLPKEGGGGERREGGERGWHVP